MAYTGEGSAREEMEISIPVPWGHVAGKAWNDTNGIRVLFVHGLQDNAGGFDSLIRLLPDNYYCIAIDLPGHGKSSHFPKGLPLKAMDYIMAVERVADFLGWDKFVYVGHSFGGHIGMNFGAIFNDRLSKLVILDALLVGHSPESCIQNLVWAYSHVKDIEERIDFGKPPEYSYKLAVQRLIEGRPDPISEKTAKTLAKRSLVRYGAGFRFSMDQRLKAYYRNNLSTEQVIELLSRIKCPFLHILTTESMKVNPEFLKFAPVKAMFEKTLGQSYRYHVVEGYHSVHMDYPERVRGLIMNFLANTKSQL